ncbi:ATP-dependent DNA ligase [Actinoplanes oblitus]|uniref:ATP-dependent DNA ligase n=1 Tax=Actinoplanes oblitus TaxID=3040509 RepID=A0ABY8WUQ9_9ACTN|nr:ATP-dependent DNA ligase [Actinoplanes oblitus]WIN00633.1 ATP-dependent DNA ligase [Actinoplanes oblitus]
MRAVPTGGLHEPRTRGTPQYEVKWDGWRCVAFCGKDIHLQSRQGSDLTRFYPDVVAHLDAALFPDTVLDGELVVWDPAAGRTSFAALQRRAVAGRDLSAEVRARPASLVVFDLLQLDGVELLDRPLLERRMLLEELCDGLAGITVCPATRDPDEARRWFDDLAATGCEGLVIKDLTSRYAPGGRGWWKWRRRTTTEAVVGGVVGAADRPTGLLLGRFTPSGRLHYVGQSTPLTARAGAELGALLTPAGPDHPWPQPLPAGWTGRFDRREPQPFVAVTPDTVVEIAVDEAAENGRWRHPVRYVRPRLELPASRLPPWSPAGLDADRIS